MASSWIARVFFLCAALWSCTLHAQSRGASGPGQVEGGAVKASKGDNRAARAEAAFKRAGRAFDSGDLSTALAQYQESYALWPRPRTLLNLGVVLRKLGRAADAANLFAEYLDSDAADPERVAAVQKNLEELDRGLARLTVAAAGTGDVLVDGKPVDPGALHRALRVAAGSHRVSQDGSEVAVTVAAGESLTVTVPEPSRPAREAPPKLPAEPPAQPTISSAHLGTKAARDPRDPPTRYYLWAGGATLVSAGVTAFLAVKLRSQQRALDDILAAPQQHDYAEAVAARDRASTAATRANVGLAVTGVGALATVVMFFLYDREPAKERPAAQAARGRARPRLLLNAGDADLSLVLRGGW
jgi:tetratricopeptide (TPR) repeat protein